MSSNPEKKSLDQIVAESGGDPTVADLAERIRRRHASKLEMKARRAKQAEVDAARAQADADRKAGKAEISRLSALVTQQQQLAATKDKAHADEIGMARADNQRLAEDLRKCRDSLKASSEQLVAQKKISDDLSAKLIDAESDLRQAKQEIAETRSAMTTANEQLKLLTSKNGKLQEELTAAKAEKKAS